MAQRILIVEDEADIARLVAYTLEQAGFETQVVGTGHQALQALREHPPDLVILDLMIPDLDGLEICRQIRSDPELKSVAVVMLTARAQESDRILGLEVGGDDYITKPFSARELLARVRAVLRRTAREPAVRQYRYGPLVLDGERHEVRVDGKEVHLTTREFALLEELLRNQGRVLTRDQLLDRVWGYTADVTTRTVDVHIRRLREKIPLLQEAIVAVKGLGYKLREEA